MQTTTVTFEFKVEHTPNDQAHLQHLATEWCRSKGATVEDGVVKI